MHLDSNLLLKIGARETAFSAIMGHMGVIESVASTFRVYLPIVMCFLCIATFLDMGSRLLHLMGIEQFVVEDEVTADLIKDGFELVKRERNKRLKHKRHSRWTNVSEQSKNAQQRRESSDVNSNHPPMLMSPPPVSRAPSNLVSSNGPPIRDLLTDEQVTQLSPVTCYEPRKNIFDDV